MTITITTNNRARPVLCGADLTPKEREDFDYLGDDAAIDAHCNFVRYRGAVYDLAEFQVFSQENSDWDGHNGGDSFFSAVYMRYQRYGVGHIDTEHVIMGTATW